MADGLRAWNEAGQLVLDVTDRLTVIEGQLTIQPGTSGTITVRGPGAFWYSPMADVFANYKPTISVNGNVISYSPGAIAPGVVAVAITITYGSY